MVGHSKASRTARRRRPAQNKAADGHPVSVESFRAAVQALSMEALDALAAIVRNPRHPRREQAAEYLIDHAWGRARQAVELTGAERGPIRIGGDDDPVSVMLRRMVAARAAAAETACADPDSPTTPEVEAC
jgi:hypothetical protein